MPKRLSAKQKRELKKSSPKIPAEDASAKGCDDCPPRKSAKQKKVVIEKEVKNDASS